MEKTGPAGTAIRGWTAGPVGVILGAMPARPAPAATALGSRSRVLLLHLLQRAGGDVAVEELAREAGVHVNTAREHLERLAASGFVERSTERRTTRGRPRVLYRCSARPAGAGLDERLRARLLADAGGGAAGSVPEDCRPQLAALEVHLEEVGLDPVVEPEPLAVGLHRCPFADLARAHPAEVCGVHLELVRGVLASTGGPLAAERLEPFVGPDRCRLHLAVRSAAPDPGDGPAPGAGTR